MNILEHKPYQKENLLEAAIVTPDNAEVMLMQADEMSKQNDLLNELHSHVDRFLARYNYQKVFLILVILILSLFLGVFFLLYRGLVLRRRMAEEAVSAKLRFFTNVSHELRTPLTLITAPVEQLTADPTLSDSQRSLLGVVKRNTDILLRLVNEILDFRKVQNGKMRLHLVHFDLAPSLRQWAEMFEPAVRKKNIILRVEVPAHLFVRSDSYKLRASQEGQRLVVVVEDTGIGIPEDKLKSIFERFFQVETPYSNGTGVGLALVKAFTQMLHGTVTAANRQPHGARFTVDFPVELPDEEKGETAADAETVERMTVSKENSEKKQNADTLTASGRHTRLSGLVAGKILSGEQCCQWQGGAGDRAARGARPGADRRDDACDGWFGTLPTAEIRYGDEPYPRVVAHGPRHGREPGRRLQERSRRLHCQAIQ